MQAFIAGDVDRDGLADIALVRRTTPGNKRELLVVAGRTGPATIVATSSASLVHRVLPTAEGDVWPAGDVDGDGRADVLIRRNARTLLALRGVVPPKRPATALRIAVTARDAVPFDMTAAGDVDGDGFGDVLVELELRTYYGEGGRDGRSVVVRGGPRARTVYVRGSTRSGYAVRASDGRAPGFVVDGGEAEAAGDVDGDGRDDLTAWFDSGTGAVVYG